MLGFPWIERSRYRGGAVKGGGRVMASAVLLPERMGCSKPPLRQEFHVERCDDCGLTRIAYNSCRNRHCGKCQGVARAEWLAARQAELLPVPYFHVVFTLPPAAAEIAFQNKQTVYGLLRRAPRPRRS